MTEQEYCVVYSSNLKTLCDEVNRHLRGETPIGDGWKLQGGICKDYHVSVEFYQALKRKVK